MTLRLDILNADSMMAEEEYYVIYGIYNRPCGRTITIQEADALCDENPELQWDIKKHPKYKDLPVMVITHRPM
jgi:hypothetical protein